MNGINYVTNEQGNVKALLLDLVKFKNDGTKAEEILKALNNLQQLINEAGVEEKAIKSWNSEKEKLKNLSKDQ